MSPVLVTGAGGFVGQVMCRELQSQRHAVRGTTRTASGEQGFPAFAVGNIGPDTDWSAPLAGCEAVIHLAAHVHVMRGQSGRMLGEYRRVNVEGSENLARQAARAGVRRFLFLSSVKVSGETSAGRAFVESYPAAPVDAYGVSKAQAEERLITVATETGMEIVIVRAPLVYGPGVKANFLSLLRAVDSGVPLPLSSISNLRSLVYVGNLVHALEACLVHPAAANRTFFVSDDHDVSTPELVRRIASALGRKPRLFPVPVSLLEGAAALFGRRAQAQRLTGSLQLDVSRIKSELGWTPPFSMRQGLMETASWYRAKTA